jgi:excisionase family DNA binding protein
MENTRELPWVLPDPDGRAPDGLACDPIHDVSVGHAAQMLGLGRTTVHQRIERGQIPAYRCHHRWLIPRAFLQGVLAPSAGHPAAHGGQGAGPSGAHRSPLTALRKSGTYPHGERRAVSGERPLHGEQRAESGELPVGAEARQELLNVLAAWLDALGCSYEPVLLGVLEDVLRQYAAWLRAGAAAPQRSVGTKAESGSLAVAGAERRAPSAGAKRHERPPARE